jgi:uroporphyrinogen decarboxylase
VEGGSSKTFARVKGMLFDRPELLHRILSVLADSVAVYLAAQIEAGAQAVMIFDTWGGSLSPANYREFSLQYMQRIVQRLKQAAETRDTPTILFTKGGGQWLESMADTGCEALGLDWTTDLADARSRVGGRVALQGNLDPCVLYASPEKIRQAVGHGKGHVFNLGHGIHPTVDPDHAAVMIEAVHELSKPYHQAPAG